ncbi:MAG TPA: carbon-nitrogen hydrolase family protein, partial [Synergistales bacterium]|nr:carbon-nitrogen hydrolase family protein [Synergistales bacterium]
MVDILTVSGGGVDLLKIACVQTRASDLHDFEATASMILRKIDEAAGMSCELMVFPECVYPSYYVGSDEDLFLHSMKRLVSLKQEIAERAREHRVYIAAGMMDNSFGRTFNKGVLWGPDGEVVGEVAKSNLWHFDRKYASPGKEYPVFDTSFGKTGLIVCADGRAPEICRILSLKGARVIIDMANLVTTGKDLSRVTNPQIDYMLPSRARENGIWLVLADKVGLEAGTILNSGGSCIINPKGEVLARASADMEEILTCEIDAFSEKEYPELPSREPWRYSILAEPTEKLPVTENMLYSSSSRASEVFASVVDFSFSDRESYMDQASFFMDILEDQDADLICLPTCPDEWEGKDLLSTAAESLGNEGTLVFTG